jgi:hypothetical protein
VLGAVGWLNILTQQREKVLLRTSALSATVRATAHIATASAAPAQHSPSAFQGSSRTRSSMAAPSVAAVLQERSNKSGNMSTRPAGATCLLPVLTACRLAAQRMHCSHRHILAHMSLQHLRHCHAAKRLMPAAAALLPFERNHSLSSTCQPGLSCCCCCCCSSAFAAAATLQSHMF